MFRQECRSPVDRSRGVDLKPELKRVLLIAGFSCVLLLRVTSAHAARPLVIDDADPLELGQVQIEAGFNYWSAPEIHHYDIPLALTYGIVPNVEAGVGWGPLVEHRIEEYPGDGNGMGDVLFTGKGKLVERDDIMPAISLAPTLKIPTADHDNEMGSGETDYDLTLIASKSLTDEDGIHVNIGYSWLGRDSDDDDIYNLFHYGVAADHEVTSEIQLVGEVFAQKELGSGSKSALQFNAGLRYQLFEGLTLDAAAGGKIDGDAPHFTTTAGLTWIFGGEE